MLPVSILLPSTLEHGWPDEAYDAWIRYVAITLSVMLHGVLFVGYGGVVASQSEKTKPSVTRLSFLAPSLKLQALPENIPEKPLVEPKPQPVQKIVKKAVARKAVVKKKVEKKVEQTQGKAVEKPVDETVPVAVAQASRSEHAQIDKGVIQRETERYLTEVMAHIERHKWYPKVARRRRIEGTVHVRFMLHANGMIAHLQVVDGPEVLQTAARKAVEKAIPIPKPPEGMHCPLACKFHMRFALDAM